ALTINSQLSILNRFAASGVCREKNLNETGWWGEHPMARSHCQPYGSNMTTLLIIVLLLALFGGGGGYYYSRRRR
ncbi:MAG TPA: hypothetical protein VF430_02985, partial [Verrucomicrobiae bacterium]